MAGTRIPVLLALVAGPAGCVTEEGRPPIARIELMPPSIPEHDGFATVVTLDGTTSADPVDDPEGTDRLEYRWEILGDDFDFEPGDDESDSAPQVRFRGDRPASVQLTVTDADGLDASATVYVQLTVL